MTMSENDYERLGAAIGSGDLEQIELMMDQHADLRENKKYHERCLYSAIREAQIPVVKYFLDLGVDVNYSDPETFLYGTVRTAIRKNHLEVAKYLYSRGAKVSTGDIDDDPLLTAIHEGHPEFVNWLITTNADIHATYHADDGRVLNALVFAKERGQTKICKLLEAAGCKVPPDEESEAGESSDRTSEEENLALLVKHMSEVFGPTEGLALQEMFPVMSEGPSIAVNVISSADRVVIFTTGMSDEAMSVTEGQEDFQYAELMMQLPADWPIPRDLDAADEGSLWPFTWLRQIAYHPHLNDTWLGGEYTVISPEDPPTPLGPNTKQTCFLLVTSADVICQIALQNKVCNVYRVLPLYTEERDLLLEKGISALWDSLQAKGVGYVLDVDRANSVTS